MIACMIPLSQRYWELVKENMLESSLASCRVCNVESRHSRYIGA